MKSSILLYAYAVLTLLLIFFSFSCVEASKGSESLMLQITTDKNSYIIGEPILIHVELINPTSESVTLTSRSSKIFDGSVWIYQKDGNFVEQIYDSSKYVFLPVITVVEIPPYGSREILYLNYSSFSLKPGMYVLTVLSGNMESEAMIEINEMAIGIYAETIPEFSQLTFLLMIFASMLVVVWYKKYADRN